MSDKRDDARTDPYGRLPMWFPFALFAVVMEAYLHGSSTRKVTVDNGSRVNYPAH